VFNKTTNSVNFYKNDKAKISRQCWNHTEGWTAYYATRENRISLLFPSFTYNNMQCQENVKCFTEQNARKSYRNVWRWTDI